MAQAVGLENPDRRLQPGLRFQITRVCVLGGALDPSSLLRHAGEAVSTSSRPHSLAESQWVEILAFLSHPHSPGLNFFPWGTFSGAAPFPLLPRHCSLSPERPTPAFSGVRFSLKQGQWAPSPRPSPRAPRETEP